MLRRQDPVHGFQRELSPAVQKVGEMGLPKSGLPAQQRDAECPPLYSAQQFQAEVLVHLSEIHLWKICRRQWDEISSHFLSKSY
jgi:hypothetical protein